MLRSGAPAAPHASGWSFTDAEYRSHKLATMISLWLELLLISLLFLPLCQSSVGNALFLCWGWNNEVDVFDVNAAAWTKPEALVRRPPSPPSHLLREDAVLIELSSPGPASEAQKPPRQCRVGGQRLHLWRGGECA